MCVNPCSTEKGTKVRGTKDLVRGIQYFLAKAGMQLQTPDFQEGHGSSCSSSSEGKREEVAFSLLHRPFLSSHPPPAWNLDSLQ